MNQCVQISCSGTQVNTDHTVFSFAHIATVLPLYTSGFVALLDKAGFVEDHYTVLVTVSGCGVLREVRCYLAWRNRAEAAKRRRKVD